MDDFLEGQFTDYELIEEMYAAYQADSQSVDASWRAFFEDMEKGEASKEVPEPVKEPKEETARKEAIGVRKVIKTEQGDVRVSRLIDAYRTYGHLMAKVDPIATEKLEEPVELSLKTLDFKEEELEKNFPTLGLMKEEEAPLKKIIEVLRSVYSDAVGVEYMSVADPKLKSWLQERIEPTRFKIDLSIDQKRLILQHLNRSELFESFLHTKYVGQKRFSLEGEETLIPMLDAIYEYGAPLGIEEIIIGMAHRGRLNVLVNVLNKSFKEVFSEFEDSYIPKSVEGSGDVKYHKGYSSVVTTEAGPKVKVTLTPNPSHLEAVDPVVEGQVLAKQIQAGDIKKPIVPVLIHGDAAVAGQGVVYETMQLSRLKGYSTGGTIHIVINNGIGFTTLPRGARSTRYCTDIARAFDAPVFHVNAENPESCVYATTLALEMRQTFGCDVFIELNGYRKYGHNETDEPAFTQPLEYQLIRKKKPIRELYRDYLESQGVLERYMAETLEEEYKKALDRALKGMKVPESTKPVENGKNPPEGFFAEVDTQVSFDRLRRVIKKSTEVPEDFTIHPKLGKLIEKRRQVADKPTDEWYVDWALGEWLAFGTLLDEGVAVRLSGQDSRRGTFSHRHAAWVDQKTAEKYYPLKHLREEQGRFDVYNSPLSEYGVLGFEYGYSLPMKEALCIWEAQFGDFCNGAQIIIDQFIATGEQKWGSKSGLTLLLPHGFEGQGPEHSSARIERFLGLCGNYNMQVTFPTTPAQFFHLLRRQVKRKEITPLIIFTPKGLLRHPKCVSSLNDLATGHFEEILDDDAGIESVKRVVFCTGRIYYDLIEGREKFGAKDMAIIRIEQLYPLHVTRLKEVLGRYAQAASFYWVQEEPSNMGAWKSIRGPLAEAVPQGAQLKYIGRKPSASPATGSFATHKKQVNELINAVFSSEEQPFYEMSYHTAPA